MASEGKRRHVFISHHHKDDVHVDNISSLLNKRGDDIRNSSWRQLKSENQKRLKEKRVSDEVIRRYLRRKISWSGKVVVLIGKDTHSRPWVNWEIEEAKSQGKRIVGVYLRGGTEADIPAALKKHASAIVGWNTDSIQNALDGANTFQSPDGSQSPRMYTPKSSDC
ncbi:TIR domain-containing protein [Spirosoma rhododendri]|uniref:TIR domain-containing protein n=1 Tax=Spirosoma rhododendri TaxID=2728024 RepID=A0A7L5DWW5_9BACT|nr:TIR domain-containing protein [Spirosoma rhododendri]QJD81148.1 TIR domain-containing protein [Spirosoma rhododendri]